MQEVIKLIQRQLQGKSFPMLVLLGTTASGKTKISLMLAKQFGAEIISSDSIQIYKELDIGSAKPTIEQLNSIQHHLINRLNPPEFYSAGKFVDFAKQALDGIYNKKKISILVGGNMLYVNCLLKGMANIPAISENIKKQVASWYQKGLPFCYQELIKRDKFAQKNILPQDSQRILRALAVVISTKKSIFEFHQDQKEQQKNYQPIFLGIAISKEEILQNIAKRLSKMLEQGFLVEVTNLLKKYSANAPALQSIGYKQGVFYLQGKLTKQEMLEQIQYKTWQYAKRQMTWYKRVSDILWIKKEDVFFKKV